MNQPTVSVVMAVRNADRFLVESIESVLDQSFDDFEFIIVDYGSEDGSKAITRAYSARDSRIKFHEIPICVLPEARNFGCFRAQGRYIAVMDADDVCMRDRLFQQVEYMEGHPQLALLGGAVEWMDSTGRTFYIHRYPACNSEIQKALLTQSVFWHPTLIMRTEAFESIGGYRQVMVSAHDYDLAVRMAEKYTCANLDDVVLRYRIHPHQMTSGKQETQTICVLATQVSATARREGKADPLDGVTKITPTVLASLGIGENEQRNSVATDRYNWIAAMIRAGEYANALSAARQIWKLDQTSVTARQISELYLQVAGIHWKEKQVRKCVIEIGQAVLVRPILIGRPLKSLLHRMKLA
jgi:hypothetical protein